MNVRFAYLQKQGTSPLPLPFKNYGEQPCNNISQLLSTLEGTTLDYRLGSHIWKTWMLATLPEESMALTLVPQSFQCCHYAYCPIEQ